MRRIKRSNKQPTPACNEGAIAESKRGSNTLARSCSWALTGCTTVDNARTRPPNESNPLVRAPVTDGSRPLAIDRLLVCDRFRMAPMGPWQLQQAAPSDRLVDHSRRVNVRLLVGLSPCDPRGHRPFMPYDSRTSRSPLPPSKARCPHRERVGPRPTCSRASLKRALRSLANTNEPFASRSSRSEVRRETIRHTVRQLAAPQQRVLRRHAPPAWPNGVARGVDRSVIRQ